jgi:hypothetical protein
MKAATQRDYKPDDYLSAKLLNVSAKMLPAYWGRWFSDIERSDMKQTDLQVFYQLGAALQGIKKISVGMGGYDAVMTLVFPEQWLEAFLSETRSEGDVIPLHDSRKAAEHLLKISKRITTPFYANPSAERIITRDEVGLLRSHLELFESEFARECKNLDLFAVTQKGLFSSRRLIEEAEKQFPENLLKVMPKQTVEDLKQAGRCLAFEVPTACAFHICRGTEALMLKYYEALTGSKWTLKKRDWGIYNDHLKKNGAPASITNRLDEIRQDRNAYTHPNMNVSLEDAPIIFNLCISVIHFMAKEIERLLSPATP